MFVCQICSLVAMELGMCVEVDTASSAARTVAGQHPKATAVDPVAIEFTSKLIGGKYMEL